MLLYTPFEVPEAAPLTTWVQEAELHILTWACILGKGKATYVYTDSWYTLGRAHDLGILWKQQGVLTSNENKNDLYVQNVLDVIVLPVAVTIIKVPRHSRLNTLEAKGNHLTDILAKNAALRRSTGKPLSKSTEMFSQI